MTAVFCGDMVLYTIPNIYIHVWNITNWPVLSSRQASSVLCCLRSKYTFMYLNSGPAFCTWIHRMGSEKEPNKNGHKCPKAKQSDGGRGNGLRTLTTVDGNMSVIYYWKIIFDTLIGGITRYFRNHIKIKSGWYVVTNHSYWSTNNDQLSDEFNIIRLDFNSLKMNYLIITLGYR